MHYPVNTGPILSNVRSVITVHDVMFLATRRELPLSPSMYQTLGRYYRRFVSPVAINRARRIMVDSDHTRQDLIRHFPKAAAKSVVVHLAPDPSTRRVLSVEAKSVLVRLGLDPDLKFVLILGGVDPRKNTERCVEAFALFSKSVASGHRLVVTGVNAQLASLLRKWTTTAGVVDLVSALPFVTDTDLIALYSLADVVLYPSLYEGFGLPVLEAMACGSPVIASTRGSVPEVAGNAAILVEPTDVRAIARSLVAVISEERVRDRLVEAGYARAREFSWSKTATQTIETYERAAAE
jgi:glycosyltransferase involved in cell wall biosynthesis